jgi:uncharacterized repeat protein (TIGR01451 family)
VATLHGPSGTPAASTVTFDVYAASDSSCSTPLNESTLHTASTTSGSSPTYTSDPFTPAHAGTYVFVAHFSGDAANASVPGGCGASGETVEVTKASPGVVTQASGSVTVGGSISDTATLGGAFGAPDGSTVTFDVYAGGDSTCATALNDSPLGTVGTGSSADGPTYTSAAFTPAHAGTYKLVARFAGDEDNDAQSSGCNDTGESVLVGQATPTISTQASGTVTVGGTISDVATLTGPSGTPAMGTVTFNVYAASDSTCSAPLNASALGAISTGSGPTYTSAAFTPSAAGTYKWVASFAGDTDNAAKTGGCTDANESVVVAKAAPSVSTQASGGVTAGGTITDTATLHNAFGAPVSSKVTFAVYAATDTSCSTRLNTSPVQTASSGASGGNPTYTSAAYSPAGAGTYKWVASFAGDGNNDAASGSCGDPNESVTVAKASPAISTQASSGVPLGTAITDTATLHGAFGSPAASTVTFNLYLSSDSSCTSPVNSAPLTTATSGTSGGNPTYTSAQFAPTASGTYKWVATFAGDGSNNGVAGGCSDTGESVTVSQTTAQADVQITKVDSPDPVGLNGALTYTITVKDNGPAPATGVTVTDALPASLTLVSASSSQGACSGNVVCAIGVLAKNASATITIKVTPTAVGKVTNTATVAANETDTRTANNTASATTTVVGPDVSIAKVDSPDPVAAGATLTYSITAKNNGPGPATGVTVSDPLPAGVVLSSSSDGCTGSTVVVCTVGSLASGASATVTIKVAPLHAGTLSNTAAVSENEPDSKPSNNTATATTRVTGPKLTITKTVSASGRAGPRPGHTDGLRHGPDDGSGPGHGQASVNAPLTYSIVVKNAGPGSASGVVVTDELPASESFVQYTATQGTCTAGSGPVSCPLGLIPSGGAVTITITVTPTAKGSVTNTAAVTANETDPSVRVSSSVTVRIQ